MKKLTILFSALFILIAINQSCKKEIGDNVDTSGENTPQKKDDVQIKAETEMTMALSPSDKVEQNTKAATERSGCFSVVKLTTGNVWQFNIPDGPAIRYWLLVNRQTRARYVFASTSIGDRFSYLNLTFSGSATAVFDVTPCTDRIYYPSCNCYVYQSVCVDQFTYNPGPPIEGNYRIRNLNSNKYVAVLNGSASNGAEIVQYDNVNQSDIEWDFLPEDDGTFRIRNMNSGRYLAVQHGSFSNGVRCVQWQDNGQGDIYWRLIKLGGNDYKIQNVKSNLFLTVFNGSMQNFGTVGQWNDIGQYELRWRLEVTAPFQTLELRSLNLFLNCGYMAAVFAEEGYHRTLGYIPDNAISSVKSGNLKVALYENQNFKGNCLVLPYGANVSCLSLYNFDRITSSLIATRR